MEPPLTESGSLDLSALRVEFTPAARRAIAAATAADGPQVVVVSWPAGAAYLPHDCYVPDQFDVVLGHIEGCPIFADSRRLALFTNRRIVLDAEASSTNHPRPPLRAQFFVSLERSHDRKRAGAASAAQAGLVHKLVRELTPLFAASVAESQIATYVRKAVSDLRGSVTPDSLPEMASRLAHHRLSMIAAPRHPATASAGRVAATAGASAGLATGRR